MRRLLIRPGAIGDCILSFPALEYLQAVYTEVWCPTAVLPLVRFADCVRSLSSTGIDVFGVVDPADQLLKSLKTFDSIISWYGANRPDFQTALECLGVPCTFHRALPPLEYAGAASDFYSEQVGAPSGLCPRISVQASERRDTIVIQPFSGSPRKNWPLDRYRQLASLLTLPVDWTCGP